MITIRNLHKRLAGEPVLNGVSLDVGRGESVALVGPSGTGKSVLLKHVIGLLLPDRGDIQIAGESIVRAGYRDLARIRSRMGYVFQDAALLDSLTIRGNLELALDPERIARSPGYAADRIAQALEMVNLEPGVLERYPAELSGGMRKRVGVARAVINAPEILLYDEPTTGLDPGNIATINRLAVNAREKLGATSLIVSHDLASLPEIADRVVLLAGGRLRFDGSCDAFFNSQDPTVLEFLGGSNGH